MRHSADLRRAGLPEAFRLFVDAARSNVVFGSPAVDSQMKPIKAAGPVGSFVSSSRRGISEAGFRRDHMMGWIARIFMAVAGLITGWFMAKDAAAFGVAQAIVAMFLVVFVVLIFIVWPPGRPGKSP